MTKKVTIPIAIGTRQWNLPQFCGTGLSTHEACAGPAHCLPTRDPTELRLVLNLRFFCSTTRGACPVPIAIGTGA
ncbi:hypothetical protein [Aquiflexum sp.]|uniref:hypothetical protein n=1 Tax=Aquiflexum sp. TaxID=1872584 RepID=UPI0035948256